jgi:threonyl-tRNA synthetase
VKGPQIIDKSLWEKQVTGTSTVTTCSPRSLKSGDYAFEAHELPGSYLDFQAGMKSYRDLPLRYGEFGQCHRNEPTGGLHGIMRVRGFTQDDGHIFCTEDQILAESVNFTTLLQKVYKDFGFTDRHLQSGDTTRAANWLG